MIHRYKLAGKVEEVAAAVTVHAAITTPFFLAVITAWRCLGYWN